MKAVTSVTVWNDAVGKRMSISYSEIGENGDIISDNNRVDRVVTDNTTKGTIDNLMSYAQEVIGE